MGVGSQFGTGPQGRWNRWSRWIPSFWNVAPHQSCRMCITRGISVWRAWRAPLKRWVPLVVWRTRIDMTKLYQTLCHFTRIWQHNSEFRGAQKNGVHWLAEFRALKMFNYYELRRFHSCAVKSSFRMVSVGWLDHVRSAHSCRRIAFFSWWPVSSQIFGCQVLTSNEELHLSWPAWCCGRGRARFCGFFDGLMKVWQSGKLVTTEFFHKTNRSKQGGWFSDV